ncbi:hypothetical protein GUJ93_ZPchr0015g6858 [Zizania palustris]|uniref:Uncharacterized protein n=1 Tax=Zizania palustris TaxID=103762 RepID=A0A8J5TGH2_ZIZPA|nr:hypothetical protein GUJ93_ZPchr0015g6858 [Zizania palustris]
MAGSGRRWAELTGGGRRRGSAVAGGGGGRQPTVGGGVGRWRRRAVGVGGRARVQPSIALFIVCYRNQRHVLCLSAAFLSEEPGFPVQHHLSRTSTPELMSTFKHSDFLMGYV